MGMFDPIPEGNGDELWVRRLHPQVEQHWHVQKLLWLGIFVVRYGLPIFFGSLFVVYQTLTALGLSKHVVGRVCQVLVVLECVTMFVGAYGNLLYFAAYAVWVDKRKRTAQEESWYCERPLENPILV